MSVTMLVATTWLVALPLFTTAEPPASLVVIANGEQQDAALSACLGALSPSFPAYGVAEPFAAVNPRDADNIVAAWMIQNSDRRFIVEASASFDGGRTWLRPQVLPLTTCAGNDRRSLDVATDPWVAFGGDGVAYVSAQTYEGLAGGHGGLQQISVITSSDGGRTWGKSRQTMTFQGPVVKTDNTAVAAHPTAPGVAYVVTTRITQPNAGSGLPSDRSGAKAIGTAALSRTTDAGTTWTDAQIVSPDRPGAYADLAQVLIDSTRKIVHLVYSRPATEGDIFMQTSTDAGQTWGPPVRASSFVAVVDKPRHPATGERIPVADDIVRAAIDEQTGAVAIAFVDGRRTRGKVSQVSVVVSRDGGSTWSEPLLVSASATPAWLPSVVWLSSEALSVAYLDGRTTAQGGAGSVNVWLTHVTVSASSSLATDGERLIDSFPLLPERVETPYFLADYYPTLRAGHDTGMVYVRTRCADDRGRCVPGRNADPRRARSEVVFVRVPR